MSVPIDDEVYGEKGSSNPDEVKQGNPGRPQSDFEPSGSSGAPIRDPSKTDHPAGEQHAAENIENEPAG